VEKLLLPTRQNLERLPSLPQVLLKILDAVSHDAEDFPRLAEIIRHDSGIASRLITVANSSYYRRNQACDTVDRALMYLGMKTVKTLVITSAVKQYFGHFNQQNNQFLRQFWLRSLISANCAQVLATLTSYKSPAEAYLCGLLMDVGQLWILTQAEEQYQPMLLVSHDQDLLQAERNTWQFTHCDVGAALIDSWQLDNFMADAVRYHHEPAAQIQHTHHLVKIINLASELSTQTKPSEIALAKSDSLFGINEDLISELRLRINADVARIADTMGIHIDSETAQQEDAIAHRELGEKLSEISQLRELRHTLPVAQNNESIQDAIQRSLYLSCGIERSVFFIYNPEQLSLEATLDHQSPTDKNSLQADFIIDSSKNDCLINRCFQQQSVISTASLATEISDPNAELNSVEMSIADRQLLNYCRQPFLLYMPFNTASHRGVLVAGASTEILNEQRAKPQLWQHLIETITKLLPITDTSALNDNTSTIETRTLQARISEAVHEASNPLSIINNYLEMLRIKLGNTTETAQDFVILKEEIERIGKILMRLKNPDETQINELVNINQLLKDLAQIFNQSMCLTRGINLTVTLDNSLTTVALNKAALKQILTNLMKNAIEALPKGGNLRVSSQNRVNLNGKNHFSITIEDNGPGISETVMKQLFKPVTSTKGFGHSGLGLSVVKKLMDDMQGQIFCSSETSDSQKGVSQKGSQFKLLFPIS
jgi:HD-like signal output (HDOD) protein/nitrogen-specific signal transduction histidine kinase